MTSTINFREYLQYWPTLYLLNLAINKRSRRVLSPSAQSALWGWGKKKEKENSIHEKKKSKKKNHAHMENCKLQTAPHPLHIWSPQSPYARFQKLVFYEGWASKLTIVK